MLSALAVVFGLGVIVFFHEAGHFVAAKLAGLDAPRFSIGFPPHILKKKIGRTEYCIGAIPLGGYVKVDLGTLGEPVTGVAWYRRALVALAGPAANLLLTAVMLVLIFGVFGWEVSVFPAVVGNADNPLGLGVGDTILAFDGSAVGDYPDFLAALGTATGGVLTVGTPDGRTEVPFTLPPTEIPFEPLVPVVIAEALVGMPAYEAGIRPGDSILTIDGKPVRIWSDFQSLVLHSRGPMEVVLSRGGVLHTAVVTAQEVDGRLLTGVTVVLPSERYILPFGSAVVEGTKSALRDAADVLTTFIRMFGRPGELVESSGGPVYVAETLTQQARTGLTSYLWTIASISLAIMIFNLLPIPVQDGGQMLLLVVEGIRGRPLSKRGTQILQQAGVVLILTIFVLIMFKDISRVVTRVR